MKIIGSFFRQFAAPWTLLSTPESLLVALTADHALIASGGEVCAYTLSSGREEDDQVPPAAASSAGPSPLPSAPIPVVNFPTIYATVIAIHYVKRHDAILTIEQNQADKRIAVLYSGWRIAGGLRVRELEHPESCLSISSCDVTGNLVVGWTKRVSVFVPETHGEENDLIAQVLFTFQPKVPAQLVALCCDCVGYASNHYACVLRVHISKKPANDTSQPSENFGIEDIESASEIVEDDHCITCGFNPLGIPWAQTSAYSLLLPSLEGNLDDILETRGPFRIADHSVEAGINSMHTRWHIMQTDALVILKAPDNVINTLALIPELHLSMQDVTESTSQGQRASTSTDGNPLLARPSVVSDVRAFISHERKGALYKLSELVVKCDDFTYNIPDEAVKAVFNDRLLFAITASDVSSVHVYTSKRLAHSDIDSGLGDLPDSLWLGNDILREGRPLGMDLSNTHLALVTKGKAKSPSALRRQETASRPTKGTVYTVEIFPLVSAVNLFEQVSQFASITPSSHPNVHHMLFDAHYLLRVNLCSKMLSGGDQTEVRALIPKCSNLLVSCIQGGKRPNWTRIAQLQVLAGVDIADIVDNLTPAGLQKRDGFLTAPEKWSDVEQDKAETLAQFLAGQKARSATSELRLIEFARLHLQVTFLVSPMEFASLVLSYKGNPATFSAPDHSFYEAFKGVLERHAQDGFAHAGFILALLNLEYEPSLLDDFSTAQRVKREILGERESLRALCVAAPGLLFREYLSDLWLPQVPPASNSELLLGVSSEEVSRRILTPLGEFLQREALPVLKDILLDVTGKVNVASCVRALFVSGIAVGDLDLFADKEAEIVQYLNRVVGALYDKEEQTESDKVNFITGALHLTWIYLHHIVGGDRNQLHDLRIAFSGSLSTRYTWLDDLPPFAFGFVPGTAAPASTLATLRQCQAFLCDVISYYPFLAEHVLNLVEKIREEDLPGHLSLRLLCLPHIGRLNDAQTQLMETNPTTVLPYTKTCLGIVQASAEEATKHWQHLMDQLLVLVQKSGKRGSGARRGGKESRLSSNVPGCEEITAAYARTLSHVATVTEPAAFLDMLPADGDVAFFLPFIERCSQHHSAKLLARDIEAESVALLDL